MTKGVGSGDKGMTSLLSGERVSKTHPRIEACGDVDELTSLLGAVAGALPAGQEVLRGEIRAVQGDLMRVGAALSATPGSSAASMLATPGTDRIAALEARTEAMEADLPRLQSFILPGGHPSAAWAHVARAVCRRAERHAAALAAPAASLPPGSGSGAEAILPYLNRLSTYLFALARWCNRACGVDEITWKG
jgi:cob(I)alamin adenosyltransferase